MLIGLLSLLFGSKIADFILVRPWRKRRDRAQALAAAGRALKQEQLVRKLVVVSGTDGVGEAPWRADGDPCYDGSIWITNIFVGEILRVGRGEIREGEYDGARGVFLEVAVRGVPMRLLLGHRGLDELQAAIACALEEQT